MPSLSWSISITSLLSITCLSDKSLTSVATIKGAANKLQKLNSVTESTSNSQKYPGLILIRLIDNQDHSIDQEQHIWKVQHNVE